MASTCGTAHRAVALTPAHRDHRAVTARLPTDLAGPVALELAQAVEQIPGPAAMRGGTVYELKWDGYRGALVAGDDVVRLWSRQGRELTTSFPDLAAAAAAAVPAGWVLDGEIVIWLDDRLNFSQLQQRMVSGAARVAALVRAAPASFVVFDVLAADGQDTRRRPWRARRALLEGLAGTWRPPLQLFPVTSDPDVAAAWFRDYRPAGIEGLVCKGASTTYTPGKRGWWKVKARASEDVIVGGVIGDLARPQVVVAARYRGQQLVMVGRTVPLTAAQSAWLSPLITAAAAGHPWPPVIGAGHFGSGHDKVALTRVGSVSLVGPRRDGLTQPHSDPTGQ